VCVCVCGLFCMVTVLSMKRVYSSCCKSITFVAYGWSRSAL